MKRVAVSCDSLSHISSFTPHRSDKVEVRSVSSLLFFSFLTLTVTSNVKRDVIRLKRTSKYHYCGESFEVTRRGQLSIVVSRTASVLLKGADLRNQPARRKSL
jgi:hypothetical protein